MKVYILLFEGEDGIQLRGAFKRLNDAQEVMRAELAEAAKEDGLGEDMESWPYDCGLNERSAYDGVLNWWIMDTELK